MKTKLNKRNKSLTSKRMALLIKGYVEMNKRKAKRRGKVTGKTNQQPGARNETFSNDNNI